MRQAANGGGTPTAPHRPRPRPRPRSRPRARPSRAGSVPRWMFIGTGSGGSGGRQAPPSPVRASRLGLDHGLHHAGAVGDGRGQEDELAAWGRGDAGALTVLPGSRHPLPGARPPLAPGTATAPRRDYGSPRALPLPCGSYLSPSPGTAGPRSRRRCSPPGRRRGRRAGTPRRGCPPRRCLDGAKRCGTPQPPACPPPARRLDLPETENSLPLSSRTTSSRPSQLRRSSTWRTGRGSG